jgi:hypothetical protein
MIYPIMSDESPRDVCWNCGGKLCWDCDYTYADIYGEGEGVVNKLHCMDCGAEVEYAIRTDVD